MLSIKLKQGEHIVIGDSIKVYPFYTHYKSGRLSAAFFAMRNMGLSHCHVSTLIEYAT